MFTLFSIPCVGQSFTVLYMRNTYQFSCVYSFLARNFLFPKNLAIPADTGNMNNLKAKNASVAYRKGEDLKEAKELAEKMKKITIKSGHINIFLYLAQIK